MGRFKKLLEKANIIADTGFQEPMQKGKEEAKQKAIQFTKEIIEKIH